MEICVHDLANVMVSTDPIYIESCAFAGFTFNEPYIYAGFECISEAGSVISFNIPLTSKEEGEYEYAKELYEDLRPTGLMWSHENVAPIMAIDIFKKYKDGNIYETTAIHKYGVEEDEQDYYDIIFKEKHYLLIESILYDILNLNELDYYSHSSVYKLPQEINTIFVDESWKYEILAANVKSVDFSLMDGRNAQYPVQVLVKFKGLSSELLTVMNLAYNKKDMKIIQKKCKLPDLDVYLNTIDDKSNLYVVADHTFVDYTINAKNPMSKIIWTLEPLSEGGEYCLISIRKPIYNELVDTLTLTLKGL